MRSGVHGEHAVVWKSVSRPQPAHAVVKWVPWQQLPGYVTGADCVCVGMCTTVIALVFLSADLTNA